MLFLILKKKNASTKKTLLANGNKGPQILKTEADETFLLKFCSVFLSKKAIVASLSI